MKGHPHCIKPFPCIEIVILHYVRVNPLLHVNSYDIVVLLVADKHHLPVISDEIYAEMIFPGHTFHSIASVTPKVPALICGGTAKQFLIPGWRFGWILIHDPIDAFKDEVSIIVHL